MWLIFFFVISGSKSASQSQTSSQTASANATTRRISQRQQDRTERLEAERIMAENQQMLQKEKEEMKLPSNNVSQSNSPVAAAPVQVINNESMEIESSENELR